MKMRALGCALGAACCFVLGGSAFAQDAAPIDLKVLKETLKQIKEKRATADKTTQAKVIQDFRNASSGNAAAMAFYEQAISATQFDGKSHERSDFLDWKRDEADKLKSDAMQNAVRLHLKYLLLTFQRADGATTRQLEPALVEHIAALTAAGAADSDISYRRDKAKDAGTKNPLNKAKPEPLFWEQEMIKQSVASSLFVQWYGVQKTISTVKDWEPIPGNVEGIYQKTLLPYYRQNKDPQVLAYWDGKIQRGAQEASGSNLAFKADQFNRVGRPSLLWQRAVDMIAIGQRNRGISEMLGLIKNYPDHPDLPAWIEKLEALINGSDSGIPAAGV